MSVLHRLRGGYAAAAFLQQPKLSLSSSKTRCLIRNYVPILIRSSYFSTSSSRNHKVTLEEAIRQYHELRREKLNKDPDSDSASALKSAGVSEIRITPNLNHGLADHDKSRVSPKIQVLLKFEGISAQNVAPFLSGNDVFHAPGQLTTDPPRNTVGKSQLSVQGKASERKSLVYNSDPSDKKTLHASFPDKIHRPSNREELWIDFFLHSQNWSDNRNSKKTVKHPDFLHKETREGLWINSSTPLIVLSALEDHAFSDEQSPSQPERTAGSKKWRDLWNDLLTNPLNWWDKRDTKRSPKSPDFVHKKLKEGLWINKQTPLEVLFALANPRFFKRPASTKKVFIPWMV